jgi:hypothetical protein
MAKDSKTNRTPKHVAVKQSDGSTLIYEVVGPCGRRKKIGHYIPIEVAEAFERETESVGAPEKSAAVCGLIV